MGLCHRLSDFRSPRRRVAGLAASLQLAPSPREPKVQNTYQSPRSNRGQPVEAPHLARNRCDDSRVFSKEVAAPVRRPQAKRARPEREPRAGHEVARDQPSNMSTSSEGVGCQKGSIVAQTASGDLSGWLERAPTPIARSRWRRPQRQISAQQQPPSASRQRRPAQALNTLHAASDTAPAT